VPQFVTERFGLSKRWVYAAFLVVSLVSVRSSCRSEAGTTCAAAPGDHGRPFGRGPPPFLLMPSLADRGGLILAMVCSVGRCRRLVAPGAILGDVVAGRGGTVVAVFQMSRDLGAVLGRWLRARSPTAPGTPPRWFSARVCAAPIAVVAAAPADPPPPAAVPAV